VVFLRIWSFHVIFVCVSLLYFISLLLDDSYGIKLLCFFPTSGIRAYGSVGYSQNALWLRFSLIFHIRKHESLLMEESSMFVAIAMRN